jgi:hypothetical protein
VNGNVCVPYQSSNSREDFLPAQRFLSPFSPSCYYTLRCPANPQPGREDHSLFSLSILQNSRQPASIYTLLLQFGTSGSLDTPSMRSGSAGRSGSFHDRLNLNHPVGGQAVNSSQDLWPVGPVSAILGFNTSSRVAIDAHRVLSASMPTARQQRFTGFNHARRLGA